MDDGRVEIGVVRPGGWRTGRRRWHALLGGIEVGLLQNHGHILEVCALRSELTVLLKKNPELLLRDRVGGWRPLLVLVLVLHDHDLLLNHPN